MYVSIRIVWLVKRVDSKIAMHLCTNIDLVFGIRFAFIFYSWLLNVHFFLICMSKCRFSTFFVIKNVYLINLLIDSTYISLIQSYAPTNFRLQYELGSDHSSRIRRENPRFQIKTFDTVAFYDLRRFSKHWKVSVPCLSRKVVCVREILDLRLFAITLCIYRSFPRKSRNRLFERI